MLMYKVQKDTYNKEAEKKKSLDLMGSKLFLTMNKFVLYQTSSIVEHHVSCL